MKTLFIVHCSATPAGKDYSAEDIRKWHVQENGWQDIGYNYVIRRDGTLELGRDLNADLHDVMRETGAHTKGYNKTGIGVCLIGGVDKYLRPVANYTAQQYTTLLSLGLYVQAFYPDIEFLGHNDLSPKSCPCFDVRSFFAHIQHY